MNDHILLFWKEGAKNYYVINVSTLNVFSKISETSNFARCFYIWRGELQKGRIAQKQYLTIALPEQKESTAVMHKSAQNKTA